MTTDHTIPPQSPAQTLAQALLLEQTRFIKKQLLDKNNPQYIQNFISQVYNHADKIQLNQVIQIEQLQSVVQKYAFELNLGADILEFIGVVAQKIHHYAVNSNAIFNDLISDEIFELWMFKILELQQLRDYIQENLQHNPQIQQISLQLANQIVESNTPWLNQLRHYTVKSQGLTSKVLSFVQDQQQNIELKLEQQLAAAIRKQLSHILLLPNDDLADISLHLWSDIKLRSLKETYSQFQSIDFEEFFILVYETWKELRQTEYMQNIILNVVEAFYEYFAEYNLQELLHSVGLDKQDLFAEADRFLPYTLNAFDQQGILEDIIQCLIKPFYLDEKTLTLIEQHLSQK